MFAGVHNNCAYGNTVGDYYIDATPPSDNISADPKLYGVHVRPDSECIGHGLNSVLGTGWRDIDGEARIQGADGIADIGADESDGCWPYTIAMSNSAPYCEQGGSVDVTAHVTDWNSQAVVGARVTFSVTDGSITHVNGHQVTGSVYGGFTDANGDVTATVTRNTMGFLTLTMEVFHLCGTGSSSKAHSVWFIDPNTPPVDVFFCLDCTRSMHGLNNDHGAQQSVKTFLSQMNTTYGVQFRVGGIKFNNPYPEDDYVNDSFDKDSNGNLTSLVFTSLGAFQNMDGITNWIDNGYRPFGYDPPELQLDALHYAAQDMTTYAATSTRKYIVLITDTTFHEAEGGSVVTKQQAIDVLTDSGCPVYISLWQNPVNPSLDSYYGELRVNMGAFDPCDYYATDMNDKYPLAELRARIVADLLN